MSATNMHSLPMPVPPLHHEVLQERLDMMLWQEVTQYRTVDYLDRHDPSQDENYGVDCVMSEQWRTRMCEWAYQLVDHFDFPREIVGTAINYLDRYLANYFAANAPDGAPLITKKQFQLVTMGCLFLAMKIQGSVQIPVGYMVKLSRGTLLASDLLAMETELLTRLSWRVNPPTAFDFLKHYLQLIQPETPCPLYGEDTVVKAPRVVALEELSSFLVELSVLDYYFVHFRPSTVAVAALLNAMDEDPQLAVANPFLQAHTLYHGYDALILPGEHEAVYLCRRRLGSLYQNSEANEGAPAMLTPAPSEDSDDKGSPRMTSPVSVIGAMNYYHPSA